MEEGGKKKDWTKKRLKCEGGRKNGREGRKEGWRRKREVEEEKRL